MKKRKSKPGRPKKRTKMLTRLIATNVDEKTYSILQKLCKKNNTTVSAYLRNHVKEDLLSYNYDLP